MVWKHIRMSLFFATLGVSGCTHTRTKVEDNLKSWIGKHPDTLVEQWGAPRSVYVLEKGSKALTFEASEVYSRTLGYYRRPDIYTTTESCKINFFTDTTQKTIESYSYSGSSDACYEMIRSVPEKK